MILGRDRFHILPQRNAFPLLFDAVANTEDDNTEDGFKGRTFNSFSTIRRE